MVMISDRALTEYGKFILSKFNVEQNTVDWKEVIEQYKEHQLNFELVKKNRPGLMYINWVVARHFGLDSTLVLEDKSVMRRLVKPRQYVSYVASEFFGYKFAEIATFYDKKSHVTISRGAEKIRNEIELYKEDRERIKSIINHLTKS